MQLKQLRIEANLSQRELADAIGVYQGDICRYETGKLYPNIKTSMKFAKYFGITLDEFYKDELENVGNNSGN